MAVVKKNCFELHGLKDLGNLLRERVDSGIPEKEAARQLILQEHERLYNDLNELRTKVNPKAKVEKYSPPDNQKEIEQIKADYEQAKAKAAEVPIPAEEKTADIGTPEEAGKTTEKGTAAGEPPPGAPGEPVKDDGGKLNDKGILTRLYNAKGTPEAAKEGFKAKGLKYQTKSQEEAAGVAKTVVEEMGIDDAVLAAESMKFDGDVNSLIFAEALNKLKEQEDAATSPEGKMEAAMKFAEVGITYDKMARYGGRFNAAINHFYKKSPLGIQLMENAKRKEDFDEWSKPKDKSWKEFFTEMMKEPEFESIIKEQVQEGMKKERAEARKARIKKVDDFIDKAKDQFKGGATYSTIIPPQVITTALEGIRQAYHAGEHVVKIVQDAIDYISKELGHDNWDKEKFKKEWEEKLRDRESKKPLTDEELKLKILNKFRNKLKGLSESQKDDVIRRSHKQLIENGALEYDDFKKIIARVTGRADLTDAEGAKIRSLVEKTNAVEDAAQKVRTERTDESLVELNKAEIEVGRAAKELNELFHNKPDIVKRLTSIMQLSTLGIPALVNNPIYNLWNQMALRFPVGVINDAIDRGMAAAAKLAGKTYDREYNVWGTQKEFWSKLGLGTREAFQQVGTGLTRQDYLDKEIVTQQQIRPFKSWKDIADSARGNKQLTRKQWWDKLIQGTVGIPAEVVARFLNVGDKPQRFAAEGAQGSAFANTLGLKDIDYKIFIKFPREEAYRNYKAQGLSDEVAGQKADAIKEAIIKEGQRSTFQQDNLLNDAITRAAGVLGGKDSGTAQLTKALVISPYIKIPSNAFWSLYNLLNPEIAIVQAGVHAANAKRLNNKGELTKGKLQNREARYWMAHAIVGIGMRATVVALVQAGTFVPGSDDDDSKKERDANAFFDKPGYVNIGDIKISNRWFGFMGMMGNAIAKKWKDATPEQREAQDDFWNIAFGGMEWEALQELENGVFSNSSSLLQSLNTGDWSRYGLNTLNMFTNIIQPAAIAQINRAALDEVPNSKGDSFLDRLNKSFAQRSTLYRNIFKVQLDQKRDIWGQTIPKGGNLLSRMFGISKANPQLFGRPVYDDFIRTQDSGFLPPAVLANINGKKLNTKQENKLQEYIGSERKRLAQPYVNGMAEVPIISKKYSELNDEKKKEVLQYLYGRGRERGLELFYKDYPQFRPKEKSIKDQIDDSIWDATKSIMEAKEQN